MKDFDLVVIGAGATWLSTAYVTAQLGLLVALIERGRMGGKCLNVGCMPRCGAWIDIGAQEDS